jgi:ABC-type phosphate transport system substrate-binding protein
MRRAVTTAVVSLGLLVLPYAAANGAPPAGFIVVVNASNSVPSLTVGELSQLLLKRTTQWRAGAAVVPVDLPVGVDVRERFSRTVHGRSAASVDTYWTKQIFSGAGVPPLTLASEREVLAFVRQNVGAIGYVSADASVGEGVKVVDVTGR